MPYLSNLSGRLLLALALILFCVVVGLAITFGGGNQRPTSQGFGDLAATVEARRTANAPTLTPTPTVQATRESTVAPPQLTLAVAHTQTVPLLTIGNQGLGVLDWKLWSVYRSPLGSAKPLQVAILGADAFDTFLPLDANRVLGQDFHFVNGGDDWTSESIQSYDLVVVSEPTGALSADEVAALRDFQTSGRGVVVGIGPLDSLTTPVYNRMYWLLGINDSVAQAFVPGQITPEEALGRPISLAPASGRINRLQTGSATWSVQGRNGATFVVGREEANRTVVFGGSLSEWLMSNPQLVHEAIRWAGNAWLFIQPLSGQITAQSSQVISAELDTSGFFAGAHLVDVVVESNDPATPRLHLPIHLEVSGSPRLGVKQTSVDFGVTYVGYSEVRTFEIENLGIADLEVELTTDNAIFGLPSRRFVIAPRASRPVEITFRPLLSQTLHSAIRLHTNDPISTTWQLPVVGEGVVPPQIALQAVQENLTLSRTFTTTNAQIQVGILQVARPMSSPTPTVSIYPTQTTTSTSGGATPQPALTGLTGTPIPTSRPTAVITLTATMTPVVQPTVVATPSNTPPSTATPEPTSVSSPAATSAPRQVFVRIREENPRPILALPDDQATILAQLGPDVIFVAVARSQDTDWLYGRITGTTLPGWIANQALILLGDPQDLPIQAP